MKVRSQWLDDFVKWFFNASPVWFDESAHSDDASGMQPADRRSLDDRRRHPDPRGASRHAGKRSDR
jgi:hypothetical protein